MDPTQKVYKIIVNYMYRDESEETKTQETFYHEKQSTRKFN